MIKLLADFMIDANKFVAIRAMQVGGKNMSLIHSQ